MEPSGIGVNVRTEDFGFTSCDYNRQMIALAPQPSDWDETSARQTSVRAPVYLVVGESDECYGAGPATQAARYFAETRKSWSGPS